MRELCVLLAPAFWSIRNDIVRFNLSFYKKVLIGAGSIIVFMVLITKLLSAGMARLQGQSSELFNILIIRGYSLIFVIIFFILTVSGFVIALNTFYQAKELETLLTSPVKRTSLFLSRLFETHARTSWMLIIFGMPLLVSSGLLYHAPFFYYVLSLSLFIIFSTIPVNIGIGAAMIVSSFFHVRELKKVLLSSGIVSVVLIVTLLRLFKPERFVNPELFANLTLFIVELKAPSFILLPNRWLSESVFHILGRYEGSDTALFVSLLLLTSYISGLFLHILFKRYYYRGWGRQQEGGVLKRNSVRGIRDLASGQGVVQGGIVRHVVSFISVRGGVIMLKDLLYQIRDVGKIHQILIVFSLITIYLFSIASLPMNWVGYSTELRYIISFFNLGLILIITAALCARIVYPAVTEEGASLWIIRTSPVTPRKYIRGKFLFFSVPLCIVGQLLAIFSSALIGLGVTLVALTVISTTIVTLALVSMAIAFGVSDLQYATGDRSRETKPGSTIQMIASASLILLTLALEIIPVFLTFLGELKHGALSYRAWALIAGAAFFLCLMNFLVTFFSLRISVGKIEGLQM